MIPRRLIIRALTAGPYSAFSQTPRKTILPPLHPTLDPLPTLDLLPRAGHRPSPVPPRPTETTQLLSAIRRKTLSNKPRTPHAANRTHAPQHSGPPPKRKWKLLFHVWKKPPILLL